MDQKLLLKEKDYELIASKRKIEFNHSFNDPLINPPKRKIKGKKNGMIGAEIKSNPGIPMMSNNILGRSTMKPVKPQTSQPQAAIKQELDTKIQATPWSMILKLFLQAYDFKKQSLDTQIGNPFGKEGLKMEEQVRGGGPIGKQQKTISLKAYIRILESMKRDLKAKWDVEDKVGSLQIAIQACKLLHDTSNAKFHALKFAYVMEIIEEFGINVFKRIKTLSFPNFTRQRINELTIKDLEGANIPESAQEISRNWLIKISSIRELTPRTIIETTLLRLHFFLDNGSKAKKVLERLAKTNRCFGQYINCIFFCTFLIRMGTEVLPQDKEYILDILDDVFTYIKQGKTKFSRPDISYDEFFLILEPFFISSFESLSQNLSKDKFKRFCSILPQNPHPVILKNFIQSFSPSLLVFYSIDIVKMLQKLYKQNKYQIYQILLERLQEMTFSQSGEFIILTWTDMSQIQEVGIFLNLLSPFSNIIFKNLPRYEKNKFYTLIIEAFNKFFDNFNKMDDKVFLSFQSFLTSILQKTEDIRDILTLEPFLQIISYFPNKIKNQLSKNVTEALLKRDGIKITDPVIVHIILSLMKGMDGKNVEQLANNFLEKVDFGDDFQKSLDFYTQMRATFVDIEKIIVSLIYKAAGLTFRARKIKKGRVTNKLLSFLQAAIAFCYITVPCIANNELKLKLYLYLSQTALANNLISQATSLIQTCINQLAEIEGETDLQIYQIFFRIICFLIVVPDDPESDYLFLFNGLFQSFSAAKFRTNWETMLKFEFYTQCIVYLSCQAQQRLPFHLDGVTSNDALFKQIEFRKALIQKIHQMVDLMEAAIKKIAEINGNTELNAYTLIHLSQCVLTLITIFDQTERIKTLIKAIVKVIEVFKEKLIVKETRSLYITYKNCLNGVNSKLKECGYQIKISL